jgi:predicted transcriptional regulator
MSAVSTSVKLDPEIKDRVQRLADSRKRSAHWVMKEAIEQYVEREETREAAHQGALKAWEQYKLTGLHLTLDEADKWLAALEIGNNIEPPACHI